MSVENYMIRDLPEEQPSVGECVGCGEEIQAGEDIFDMGDFLLHQYSECCKQYIENTAICRTAGE